MTINDNPPGQGLPPLPPGPSPANKPLPGYWLCQFELRIDLPSAMPVANMEAWLAQVFAVGANAAGLPANIHVSLIATSEGSVANPTAASSVAIPPVGTPATSVTPINSGPLL